MTTTTHATPEPDDAATTEVVQAEAPVQPAPPAQPAPPVTRTLSTGAIIGIAGGGLVLAAVLFGGGVAVGTALPAGGSGGSSHIDFPGDQNRGPGQQGTRPDAPRGDTNRSGPAAPNSDQTETSDDSDAGS